MKKTFTVLALILLSGCAQNSQVGVTENSASSAKTSSVTEAVSHQLAPTSEVRSLDNEWNEYVNHTLNLSIKFPKRVLEDTLYNTSGENPALPVKVIESGEIITFSRSYSLDITHLDSSGNATHADEDLSPRHPYYSAAYLNEPIYPHYPYQMYAAKADSIEDVRAFMKRAYGEGCTVVENSGSMYENRPGVLTFTVGPKVKNCPGYYPVGDVVTWYRNQNVVVGIQPGWTGNFAKPYPTKLDENKDYTLEVKVPAE